MDTKLSDAQISEALQSCADEPAHIPGIVQPFGCLLSVSIDTGTIDYASENCLSFLDEKAKNLLGRQAREVLGREPWHGVRNAVSRSSITTQTISAGTHLIGSQICALQVHQSASQHVIEIEPTQDVGLDGAESLSTLSYLMSQIQSCGSEQKLFELTVEMLQHLTSYDRVLIYRFDPEWNGEVLAEVKHGPIESFMGLRFPHWDIPAQAREIMARIPVRFISDVAQDPIAILAAPDMPPLDISLAEVRGVSPVHMEYLRNMGIAGTMTLSVKVEGKLWGIISFHHRRPKVPAPAMRDILKSFLLVFSGKLETLQQQAALAQIQALDKGFVGQKGGDYELDSMLPAAAPVIMEVMQAQGIAALNKGDVAGSGNLPDINVMAKLSDLALSTGEVVVIDNLAERFPELSDSLNGVAGALVMGLLPDRVICIFRNEIQREVAWAGNPQKTIETMGDRVRLSPRGSFSTFLELVKGRGAPWSDNDIYLVGHLRTLLHAAERQAVMETLNRQQTLMIGELNHRVRNILALVRSVSRQARRRYASLDSYANAIENRIRALAAAHDISGGRSTSPVSVYDLFQLEFEPFHAITEVQATIEGPDMYLLPEVAPIFSLVIHELTTNAAKYGALLEAEGRIKVNLSVDEDKFRINWHESGVPNLRRPNELGFGMALIEQAVPHELSGTTTVEFGPEGLHAEFTLPLRHFSETPPDQKTPLGEPIRPEPEIDLPAALENGTVMVLEDNYIIAKEMSDLLRDLGCLDVRTCASVDAALDILEGATLLMAVLDVNLGSDQTSAPVALRLAELGVPFVFVTGYGEDAMLPDTLEKAPRLTKPISSTEFIAAARRLPLGS